MGDVILGLLLIGRARLEPLEYGWGILEHVVRTSDDEGKLTISPLREGRVTPRGEVVGIRRLLVAGIDYLDITALGIGVEGDITAVAVAQYEGGIGTIDGTV